LQCGTRDPYTGPCKQQAEFDLPGRYGRTHKVCRAHAEEQLDDVVLLRVAIDRFVTQLAEAKLTRLRTDRRPSDREWEERWEGENKRAEAAEAKLTRYAAVVTAAMWVRRFLSVWDDRSGVWVRGADTETTVVAVEKFLAALDQQENK
jgi:hypothetical protein